MNFSWFADLGHLASTGSFSRAAELSHISQPAFSRRIQAIEAWAGVRLVDRSTQPVRLTGAGRQILETGRRAIAELEAERRQILEAAAMPAGEVVRFAAQHSIGWRFYPAWMQAFEHAFGPVNSRLRADDLPACVRDLEAGEVDFVIAYQSADAPGIAPRPRLDSLVIGHDRLVPVCRAGAGGRPVHDLSAPEAGGPAGAIPFLRFGPAAPISRHLAPLIERRGLAPHLRVVYENSMSSALRIRARDGAGIAWLPLSLVVPDLAAGLLARTGPADLEVALEIRIHRLRGNTTALTRAIWSYLAVREPEPLISGA